MSETSITTLLEKVARTKEALETAQSNYDTARNELKNSPLLADIGLQVKEDKPSSAKGSGKGAKRLNGDRKENLKPILQALITKSGKSGIKRTALEGDSEVVSYCSSLTFAEVPNLAPVLKEMVKANLIKTKGEKVNMVYVSK